MRRPAALLALSLAVPALVVVVPTIGGSSSAPHPVTPTLTTVALAGVDDQAWAAETSAPAPADANIVRVPGERPQVFTAPVSTADFSLVGVTWDQQQSVPVEASDLSIMVRTHSSGTWQPWATLSTDSGDGPAEGEGVVPVEGADGAGRPARVGSSPYFSGPSDGIQVRVDVLAGSLPAGLRADLVDPGVSDADNRLVAAPLSAASAAAGAPDIITRAQWGADESLRNAGPTYEPKIKVAFVHHTASSSSYTKSQAAAAVRAMYAYDVNSLGWSDIAYNVLVDKFGQVFEGRYGGLQRAVRSGATGGFNGESWAVSAIGNYVGTDVTTALQNSIEKVLAWKLGLEHMDPRGTAKLTAQYGAGTTARYSDGTKVTFDVISGHRDAGSTACPGTKLYALLPSIRAGVEARMGAGLVKTKAGPLVVARGESTPIRVRGTALTAQSWRLEVVAEGTSNVIRSYSGTAAKDELIDVSWDLKDSSGSKVPEGVYTVTLQSWNDTAAAVPYAVNVGLFADPDVFDRPSDGVFRLEGLGYGHGHGLSQFGAEGAARKGLTSSQIVNFYYPGTKQASAPDGQKIRVRISAGVRASTAGPDVKVRPVAGLQVSEGDRTLVLPQSVGGKRIKAWRALLKNGTLGLYGWTGSAYEAVSGWTGRDGPFRFTNAPTAPTTARVTLIRPGGTEVVYRGAIEARRNGAHTDLNAVSIVLLDDYVKSVVSAEMPGGWSTAAYEAQAIAARSYAMFKRTAAVAAGSAWHICDTTQCQAYNGYSGETSPESKAGTTTAGIYLTYAGAPIFAEFSSANGGWTSDGGKPYLVAKQDPYDGVLTGTANWGHAWTKDVTAAAIQSAYPAIGKISRIVVTGRVGQGDWGGRVTSVRLEGSTGKVTVSGTSLRSALGLKSEWFRAEQVAPPAPKVVIPKGSPTAGVPTTVRSLDTARGDRIATVSWKAPSSSGSAAISGYRLKISPGDRVITVPATTRSVTVDRLMNRHTYTVAVRAKNARGHSRSAKTEVTPTSPFGYQRALPATLLWKGALATGGERDIDVLGVAGVPTSHVLGVTLRVTAKDPAGSTGWLKVSPTGSTVSGAQQTVSGERSTTNLIFARPGAGGSVTVKASTAADVRVQVVGYQTRKGGVGQRLKPTDPVRAASGQVPGGDKRVSLVGDGGVRAGTPAVLLHATVKARATSTKVRLSPDGSSRAAVPVVTVPAGEKRTVLVVAPLAADGSVHILASGSGPRVLLDVYGRFVVDSGTAAKGRVRLIEPARIYDSADVKVGMLSAGATVTIPALGQGGVPATGVSAVVLTVIAATPQASGMLAVYPAGIPRPAARALAYDATVTARSTVVAKVGANGAVQVYAPKGATEIRVDVAGYVTG